jgi:hypothetical protein
MDHIPPFQQHDDWKILENLFKHVRSLQALAEKHGVPDIFQDNGGKLLQIALVTGLTLLKSREGNDAVDLNGKEYELKTVNIRYAAKRKQTAQFTTHHHLNPTILAKYRQVNWLFAVYDGIELREIYFMPPQHLEPIFMNWENKWHESGGKDINNPKIPMRFVLEKGIRIYPQAASEN